MIFSSAGACPRCGRCRRRGERHGAYQPIPGYQEPHARSASHRCAREIAVLALEKFAKRGDRTPIDPYAERTTLKACRRRAGVSEVVFERDADVMQDAAPK